MGAAEEFGRAFKEVSLFPPFQKQPGWGTRNARLVAIAGADRDAFASLGAATGQHGGSALGLHTAAESVRLGATAPVRLKSALRHGTSNSSNRINLPGANAKYSRERAGGRGTDRGRGKTTSLEGITLSAQCSEETRTNCGWRSGEVFENIFGSEEARVEMRNVALSRQNVTRNFSLRGGRNFFCTSCAALMELALDACAQLREIADSSESVGDGSACE